MKLRCWRCGFALRDDLPRIFPRLERCPGCGADLHTCRQCRHYAPRYVSLCAHDQAEPPRDRETANFCQFFRPSPHAFAGEAPRDEAARSELEALFGGEPSGSPPADGAVDTRDAMTELKTLFGEPDDGEPGGEKKP